MDYKKVQDKYEDSLSRFNISRELNSPKKFGPLNFNDVENKVTEMVSAIYDLEFYDFREKLHTIYSQEVNGFRNDLIRYFNEIINFDVKLAGAPETQQRIINDINTLYNSRFNLIIDNLRKIKTDELLNRPKGKELDEIIEKSKENLQASKKIIRDVQKIKIEMEKQLEEAKKGTEEAGESKGKIASVKTAKYFSEQADEHKKNAIGEEKTKHPFKKGWLGLRNGFFVLIFILIITNIVLYFIAIFSEEKSSFKKLIEFESGIEYGILSLSLLLILYIGMSFATNNYSMERNLEVENKNRSNIANTLELFLSLPQSGNSKSIVLQEAVKTLFSHPKPNLDNNKIQSINTPITEVTRIMRGGIEKE